MKMQRRTQKISTQAWVGFGTSTVLGILAAANFQLQKVDSKYTYAALSLALLSLLYGASKTPVRNLIPHSLFKTPNKEISKLREAPKPPAKATPKAPAPAEPKIKRNRSF
jgi:hypothetical protein